MLVRYGYEGFFGERLRKMWRLNNEYMGGGEDEVYVGVGEMVWLVR
jgi:hypothetical protein